MSISLAFVLCSLLVATFGSDFSLGQKSGSCPFHGSEGGEHHHHHHDHDHGHDDDHHHLHHHHHQHHDHGESLSKPKLLPEELAEEEDLELLISDSGSLRHRHDHFHSGNIKLSKIGLWTRAMGCSLLVSMASLICLTILPVIFFEGKPSKTVVDSLATFGAGAMLGDAFLHQLPHAFGGEHSHSHDHYLDHVHEQSHDHGHAHSHSHSLQDLSVGLAVLAGIVLFLLVEKAVRYVEDHSGKGTHGCGHGHHPHHHRSSNKLKDDEGCCDNDNMPLINSKNISSVEMKSDDKQTQKESVLRKRNTPNDPDSEENLGSDAANGSVTGKTAGKEPATSPSSLVFGYLNLFSDGVHNFTDGMALGSAFLHYGSVGGWSRTLFLLAHELPQEVGDFGILVRSGFSVSKALFLNFLSALVALAGTALALILGQDPGQSSLIEGLTAGGFIYIAVAGVLPEMNSGKTTLRSTVTQLTSLILGMAVALSISFLE